MKGKKGFTLVELLAVIAILAILMLLIMPNVLNMFQTGRKDTFKVQIESIIREAQKQKQVDIIEGKNYPAYCDGIGTGCTEDMKLDITNTNVKYGVMYDDNSNVVGVLLSDSNYCYINYTDVNNINPDDFVEGASLVCNDSGCSCTK